MACERGQRGSQPAPAVTRAPQAAGVSGLPSGGRGAGRHGRRRARPEPRRPRRRAGRWRPPASQSPLPAPAPAQLMRRALWARAEPPRRGRRRTAPLKTRRRRPQPRPRAPAAGQAQGHARDAWHCLGAGAEPAGWLRAAPRSALWERRGGAVGAMHTPLPRGAWALPRAGNRCTTLLPPPCPAPGRRTPRRGRWTAWSPPAWAPTCSPAEYRGR